MESIRIKLRGLFLQGFAISVSENQSGGDGLLKDAQSLIVKTDPYFFSRVGDIGEVDMDGLGLTDAVKSADSLFQEFGVFGQVPKNQMVSKLEVAPFASDLRAEEYAGPFGVGKVGGLSVALDKIQLLRGIGSSSGWCVRVRLRKFPLREHGFGK